jgi:hypothetical protein
MECLLARALALVTSRLVCLPLSAREPSAHSIVAQFDRPNVAFSNESLPFGIDTEIHANQEKNCSGTAMIERK